MVTQVSRLDRKRHYSEPIIKQLAILKLVSSEDSSRSGWMFARSCRPDQPAGTGKKRDA